MSHEGRKSECECESEEEKSGSCNGFKDKTIDGFKGKYEQT